jgi:hypothetical protein
VGDKETVSAKLDVQKTRLDQLTSRALELGGIRELMTEVRELTLAPRPNLRADVADKADK